MGLTKIRIMQFSAWATAIFIFHSVAIDILIKSGVLIGDSDAWPFLFKTYCDIAFSVMVIAVVILWLGCLSHAGKRMGAKNRNYGWWLLAQLFIPVIFTLIYYICVYMVESQSTQQKTGAEIA